ncbi:MAG: hypothetical protein U0797_01735 [Gemmataceae bacterium]
MGDWGGNGGDGIGVFHPPTGTWLLRDSATAGAADHVFRFGAGLRPVVGDWDDNGRSDAGAFRSSNGVWQLRSSADAGGVLLRSFQFGPGGLPVTGTFPATANGQIAIADSATWASKLNLNPLELNLLGQAVLASQVTVNVSA